MVQMTDKKALRPIERQVFRQNPGRLGGDRPRSAQAGSSCVVAVVGVSVVIRAVCSAMAMTATVPTPPCALTDVDAALGEPSRWPSLSSVLAFWSEHPCPQVESETCSDHESTALIRLAGNESSTRHIVYRR